MSPEKFLKKFMAICTKKQWEELRGIVMDYKLSQVGKPKISSKIQGYIDIADARHKEKKASRSKIEKPEEGNKVSNLPEVEYPDEV